MGKAIDLSTAGMMVAYAIETTAGTKPTKFINIPKPKSIPDFNPDPSTYDSTSLNEVEWKTYIQGLKDTGGVLPINFGMSQKLLDMWDKICDAVENVPSGERMWMEFYHPKLNKAFFFTCSPSRLGFSSADVDSVWDTEVKVVPTGEIGWDTAIKPAEAA